MEVDQRFQLQSHHHLTRSITPGVGHQRDATGTTIAPPVTDGTGEGGGMPSAVIELVLGLIFVFFLFSMLCSGINELIARALGKRADFLAAGLWSLLDNSKDPQPDRGDRDDNSKDPEPKGEDDAHKYFKAFQQHPLVKQLGQAVSDVQQGEPGRIRGKWRTFCAWVRKVFTGKSLKDAMAPVPYDPRQLEGRRARPSYIPPAIFGTVVASFLRESNDLPNMPKEGGLPETDEEREAAERRRETGTPLQKSLQSLVDEAAGDAQRLRASLERWYDAQMERVSGWYKRESKRILLVLATLVVLVLNVDTVAIARTLWTSPTARRAVADAAAEQIQVAVTTTTMLLGGPAPVTPPAEQPNALPLACPDPNAPDGEAAPTTTSPSGSDEVVAQALDCATSLPIPIGWRLAQGDWWNEAWESFKDAFFWGWLLKLLGWGLTVGALTFGAPFWFDLLNRFGSLRAAGVKPKPSTETAG